MERKRDGKGKFIKSNRICKIDGCSKKHKAKGLCNNHYNKIYRTKHIKQYHQDNKKYLAEYKNQYRKNNKNHCLKLDKQSRIRHKEYRNKYSKQYRQTPAGKAAMKAGKHNRRILEKGLTLAII